MTDLNVYKFEQLTKKLISNIYRVFIVLVSILIILFGDLYFSIYLYIVGIVLYLFIYYEKIRNTKPLIRLIVDYIFIIFILYDKNLFNLLEITLFLLPFINSPNHTSKNKKTSQLFLVAMVSFCFLYFTKYEFSMLKLFEISISLSIISFFVSLEYLRSILIKNILEGYQKIDNINFEKSRASNIPNIYNQVISILNNNLFSNFYMSSKIEHITCVNIDKNIISIKNSSTFFSTIDASEKDIQRISSARKKSKSIFNIKLLINKKTENKKNMIVYILYKNKYYYFLLFFDNEFSRPNFIMKILIHHYLMPIFKKVLQTISFEEHIKDTQLINKKKILDEMKYVAITNKSLHTLNNQFTPIKTYFKMLDDYESFPLEKHEALDIMIKKTKNDAQKSFKRIVELSEYLLDKNQNPFSIKHLKDYKIKVLYMRIKQIWNEKFTEDKIEIEFSDEFWNYKIISDMYLLEILFIDIIENMSKYSDNGDATILFKKDDKNVIIILSNLVNLSPKERKKLITNIQLFNNDDRAQLLLKKGHGFANMKELVTNLNLNCTITLQESIFEMKVIIKLKE